MKIAVLRHAHYDEQTGSISESGRRFAEKAGRDLSEKMGIAKNVTQILLVSSSAPRAIETIDAIRKGIDLEISPQIHHSPHLWDESKVHKGDIPQALTFIKSLPDALFLIIVTHGGIVGELSGALGNERSNRTPGFLEGSISDTDTSYKNFYDIPLNKEKTVIKVLAVITDLQKHVGTWRRVQTSRGEGQFFVPPILPIGDMEYSLAGGYDKDGYFPVSIDYISFTNRDVEYLNTAIPGINILNQYIGMEAVFGELSRSRMRAGREPENFSPYPPRE